MGTLNRSATRHLYFAGNPTFLNRSDMLMLTDKLFRYGEGPRIAPDHRSFLSFSHCHSLLLHAVRRKQM